MTQIASSSEDSIAATCWRLIPGISSRGGSWKASFCCPSGMAVRYPPEPQLRIFAAAMPFLHLARVTLGGMDGAPFVLPRFGAMLRYAAPRVFEGSIAPVAVFVIALRFLGVTGAVIAGLGFAYSLVDRKSV